MVSGRLGKNDSYGRAGWRPVLAGLAMAGGMSMLAPAAFAVNPACGDAIRIMPGDTLAQVAGSCDTTIGALLAANPAITQPSRLFVGQLVFMPGRHQVVPRPTLAAPQVWLPAAECDARVQVRPGDTFSVIARRCGVTPAQLLARNPQVRDPNRIFAGMVLQVPTRDRSGVHISGPAAALRVTGTITAEGINCQAMRGDDGQLYTFSGHATRPLHTGQRVTITGTRAGASVCQQGLAINPSQIVLLDAPPAPVARRIDITGTITREGVTCTALRGDDGQLYTLAGQTGGFQPGDRVRITGDLAQASFCQQGTTVTLQSIGQVW